LKGLILVKSKPSQFYRLTYTDITQLESEADELAAEIKELLLIFNSEKELHKVFKQELRQIKKNYGNER
ncbi:hypothetical protein, partial [Enterococcus faecalis]|uniref:hypothetical protein n=1 Tax=Enterococcus faecalis TaxID=1351 RepID=UPI003CC5AA20